MSISPQGYNMGNKPLNENPFWSESELDNVERIYATATETENGGSIAVEVSKRISGNNIYFDFNFQNTKGNAGQPGNDGFSPTVAITPMEDGNIVRITDATGPHSFEVKDGTDGRDGVGISNIEYDHEDFDGNKVYKIAMTNNIWYFITVPKGDKGDKGDPGQDGAPGATGATPNVTATATVSNTTGTPSVNVVTSGTAENPVLNFSFSGIKGEPGEGGGGGGTSDYDQLTNKPAINGHTLTGNQTGAQLGLTELVEVTEAQYEALEQGGDVDPTKAYFINDADPEPLGSAAYKNYTDRVRPDDTGLVESRAVFSAINTAVSSIYKDRGPIACADLTSDLLVAANVGNVYETTDSGTTSALFIQGAGHTINAGDNVGIIRAGSDSIMFNYMGDAFDLTGYQKEDLTTPVTYRGTQYTSVEAALAGLMTQAIQGSSTCWADIAPQFRSTGQVHIFFRLPSDPLNTYIDVNFDRVSIKFKIFVSGTEVLSKHCTWDA